MSEHWAMGIVAVVIFGLLFLAVSSVIAWRVIRRVEREASEAYDRAFPDTADCARTSARPDEHMGYRLDADDPSLRRMKH